MPAVTVVLTAERLGDIARIVTRYRELRAQEKATGRASFELFDVEEAVGAYLDVLECITDASPQH